VQSIKKRGGNNDKYKHKYGRQFYTCLLYTQKTTRKTAKTKKKQRKQQIKKGWNYEKQKIYCF
jgi:hypothetical protein